MNTDELRTLIVKYAEVHAMRGPAAAESVDALLRVDRVCHATQREIDAALADVTAMHAELDRLTSQVMEASQEDPSDVEAWLRADTDRDVRVRYTGGEWSAAATGRTGVEVASAFGQEPATALARLGRVVRP